MFVFPWIFFVARVSAVITIDDKLDPPFTTDCFKRLSIGERLVIYDVTKTSEQRRVKDCEEECNNNKCTFFSFGISAMGNGTCELSTRREISRRRDTDYDIYQRTRHCMEGRPTGYEESCYRRLHIGRRLNDRHIRHSLPCDTLQACQHQCSVEQQFECHGFNIRLDESGLGRGICELTSVPLNYLDADRDFHRDPDFDYYEKDTRNPSPNCGYTNEIVSVIPKNQQSTGTPQEPWPAPWTDHRPWTSIGTSYHPNEIPTFSGFSGKKERVYNTKPYDLPQGRSMGPSTARLPGYVIIDADQNRNRAERPREQGRNLQPDFHGHHYPYPPPEPAPPAPHHPGNHHRQVCFQREYPAMRLRPDLIRESHTFHKVSDCENMCMSARFKCSGFMFRYARLPDTSPNCFLTDLQHLHLSFDRDCDVYFRMPGCQQLPTQPDTDCFSQWTKGNSLRLEVLQVRVASSSVSECELECLRSDSFVCRSFSFKSSYHGENCLLSDWPVSSLTPAQFQPDGESSIYERGSFGRGCEFDVGPPLHGPNHPHPNPTDVGIWGRDAWQHFTVRGWPCRRGTQCALNKDAGFWSCEVEGGDLTQWDYCCRPQHACGYSQGYSYPWCYVGEAGPDQWRPCSEHYYPDYDGHRPTQPFEPHRPWTGEYGPPSRWPISYLYPEPPPNETIYFQPNSDFHSPPNYDSPKIQFRPSSHANYPKAFVQKLDLKGTTSDVPENLQEPVISINPRTRIDFAKKVKEPDGRPGFSQDSSSADFQSTIPYINDTITPTKVNKTKAILDQIEKIIEEGTNCNVTKEKMESESSEGLAYAHGFFNESYPVFTKPAEDSAMSRFWNWGQENYFSNKRKRS